MALKAVISSKISVFLISNFKMLQTYAQVTLLRTGGRISHGYNPASFVANRIGP